MSCGRKRRSSKKWNSWTENVITMSKMPGVHKQGKWLWDKVYYVRSEKLIIILEENYILFLERLEIIRNLKKTLRKQTDAVSGFKWSIIWTWQPRFAEISLKVFFRKSYIGTFRKEVGDAIALEVKCQRKMYSNSLQIKAVEWEIWLDNDLNSKGALKLLIIVHKLK